MKRIAVVLAVLALATVAFAQDASKAQVFGGYQFLSLDGGAGGSRTSVHGLDFDAAFRAAKNVSVVADFGMGFKTVTENVGGTLVDVKTKTIPILFGPRFVATSGKVSPFAEVLFGVAHLSGSVAGVSDSTNKFAYAFGGGLDYNANKNMSIRLAKFDYLGIRGGEGVGSLNNLRYAAGVVFKF